MKVNSPVTSMKPAMARQTKTKAPRTGIKVISTGNDPGISLWKAACLVAFAGFSSSIYRHSLSPSHGSIPASQYRSEVTVIFTTLSLILRRVGWLPGSVQPSKTPFLLAALATWSPLVHFALAPTARLFGPALSAALISGATYGLMVTLAVQATIAELEARSSVWRSRGILPFLVCGMIIAALSATELKSDAFLPRIATVHPFLTRSILPFLLPPPMMLLVSSRRLFWLSLIPYILLLILNPHSTSSILASQMDQSLVDAGHAVLHREDSLTGFLSVVENRVKGYRVLRCDHSLLGGEWVFGLGNWPGGEGYDGPNGVVGEPVYAIFVMLEAVRLVQDHPSVSGKGRTQDREQTVTLVPDHEAEALVM